MSRKEFVEDPAEELARLEKRFKILTERKEGFEQKSMFLIFTCHY